VRRVHLVCAMATSQSTGKGARSGKTARFEPQRGWDSFSLATDIPKYMKGTILLPAEKTRSNRGKYEAEGFTQEGKTTMTPSPQQKMPWRRGRSRKKKEIMEARVAEEPCIRSIAKELLRHAIWLEPAGGSSQRRQEQNEESGYHRRK
jgi:hypothetical protein